PEHLLEFCARIPEWCVLVALIGDGQAIHVGEEGGTTLWAEALKRVSNPAQWTVHAAPHFAAAFHSVPVQTDFSSTLNLDTEIRFHLTPKVHEYVEGLLECKPAESLRRLADELHSSGHRFLVSRDLRFAKGYLRDRYSDAKHAR